MQLLLDGQPIVAERHDLHLPDPTPGTDYVALATREWAEVQRMVATICERSSDGLEVLGRIQRAEEWFRSHQSEHPLWEQARRRRWRAQDELGAIQVSLAWAEICCWHACCGVYVCLQYTAGRRRLERAWFGQEIEYPQSNPPAAIWDVLELGRRVPAVWPWPGTIDAAGSPWTVEMTPWGFQTGKWTRGEMAALVDSVKRETT